MTSLLMPHNETFGDRSISSAANDLFAQRQLFPQHKQQLHSNTHPHHDARYYASCYIAGGMSSSIRWVLSPLELVKTRMQAGSSGSGSNISNSISGALRNIYALEGAAGLFRGLGPTSVAYGFQTSTKYGLYEVLKDRLTAAALNHHTGSTMSEQEIRERYRVLIYVTAAATAEAVADVLMCPWEMIRVKIQTATAGSNHFPTRLGPAFSEMVRNRQHYNYPFGSLAPLWGRQIPGTIVNFYTFETAVSMIYSQLPKPKEDYSGLQQLGVTFAAGYMAGFCSAVISHPADSLVSLMALPQHSGKSAFQIAKHVGLYQLATKGLAPRILITGKIISVQWLLYDSFKSLMGLGTTGGN